MCAQPLRTFIFAVTREFVPTSICVKDLQFLPFAIFLKFVNSLITCRDSMSDNWILSIKLGGLSST